MTLDDLIALNDEIAALVRAGVPLEQGLAELGGDLPGRMGKTAALLAERTARGEPLTQVIMDQTVGLPRAYRAVVEAGVKAGRLPAALEALAGSARRVNETQRFAAIAVVYPLLVFALAWGCLACFARFVAPALATSFHGFGLPGEGFFAGLAWFGHGAMYWGPAVPLLLLVVAAAAWFASTRAGILHSRGANRLLGSLPWMGKLLRWSETAALLEVLALLVENRVPLGEAIRLAADVTGDPQTIAAMHFMADRIERGEQFSSPSRATGFASAGLGAMGSASLGATGSASAGLGAMGSASARPRTALAKPVALDANPALPPLVNWLMLAAGRNGALEPALRHSADAYRRRARHQADLTRVFLPVVLTVGIAGVATAAYALVLFVPYAAMLHSLAGG